MRRFYWQAKDAPANGRILNRKRATSLLLALAVGISVSTSAHCQAPESSQAVEQQSPAASSEQDGSQQGEAPVPQVFDIDEYRVEGAEHLPQVDVEEAVYPYLGPGKTPQDIEKARAAVEAKYHDRGYQTVSVAVRHQDVANRYVAITVTELKIGDVRVKGSRYHDLETVKGRLHSVQKGKLAEFGALTKESIALNQWPDRRVTPALRAGVTPGTVDLDLNVEDKLPLHASVELNNRQSPNTTALRLNGTVHYDNLWQRGHSLTFTYQTAPERRKDMEAFSGSYLARIPDSEWISLLFYGVISRSDVALLGDMNVVGPGEIAGVRAVMTLPSKQNFFHTLSAGIDYKNFGQILSDASGSFSSPITYYPTVLSYGAVWRPEKSLTQINATLTYGLRGFGSDSWLEWDTKRYGATPNFFVLSGDISETYDLPEGFQLFAKVGGQMGDQPLVSSEQFSLGGLQTVRGYLESTTLGDSGAAGTFEIRSPDIGKLLQTELEKSGDAPKDPKIFNEWRLFGFVDGGYVMIHEPLPETSPSTKLWSFGAGTTFKALDHLNGMLAVAIPKSTDMYVKENDPRFLFRVWGEF